MIIDIPIYSQLDVHMKLLRDIGRADEERNSFFKSLQSLKETVAIN